MLNQVIASSALGLIARIVREGDESLVPYFWDLMYLYRYGLGHLQIPHSPIPPLPTPDPSPPREVHDRLLFELFNALLGDPNPQPNLVGMLGAREARLAGAKALQSRVNTAQQHLAAEIGRLEGKR